MKQVSITWKAFGDRPESGRSITSVQFEMHDSFSDEMICNMAFHNTNVYAGPLWDEIKDILPENRTHTALSVGDWVRVDDKIYRCDPEGWSIVAVVERITRVPA